MKILTMPLEIEKVESGFEKATDPKQKGECNQLSQAEA